jgi:hypothetical protein
MVVNYNIFGGKELLLILLISAQLKYKLLRGLPILSPPLQTGGMFHKGGQTY